MPTRLPDWNARLSAYLAAAARTRFAWGRHDCALFAAGAVEAVRGERPALDLPSEGYTSLPAALRVLRKAGYGGLGDLPGRWLEEIHPALAAAGDVALVADGAHDVLGVVQGEAIYVLRRDGLGLGPRAAMRRAWRC